MINSNELKKVYEARPFKTRNADEFNLSSNQKMNS